MSQIITDQLEKPDYTDLKYAATSSELNVRRHQDSNIYLVSVLKKTDGRGAARP